VNLPSNQTPPRVARVTRSFEEARTSDVEDPVPSLIPSSPALQRSRVNPNACSSPPNHTLRRATSGSGVRNRSSPRDHNRRSSSTNYVDDTVTPGNPSIRVSSSPRYASYARSPFGTRTSAHASVNERDLIHNRLIQSEPSNLRAGLDRLSLLTEPIAVRTVRTEHNRH